MSPPNPVTASHANPQWAQLTRLAGNRAAILFDDLRKRMGTLEGLIEELHYDDVEKRWVPRYRLGKDVLFTAHILPAALEATLTLDEAQRDTLLSSRRLASAMKQLIRQAPTVEGLVSVRVRLNTPVTVRAFATLIAMRGKLIDLSSRQGRIQRQVRSDK